MAKAHAATWDESRIRVPFTGRRGLRDGLGPLRSLTVEDVHTVAAASMRAAESEVSVTGYTAPSTGRTVRAVLFDTFGTVVDWRSGVASAVRVFAADKALTLDPEEFADAWRAQYEPAKERVRSGQRPFVSLDTLHRENLGTVLRAHDIDPDTFTPGELTSLAAAWHFLPPWPDSVEGIRQIRRHFIVGPLSNGNTALLVDMAKSAGLPWDVILGSDVSRAYKPSPDAYRKPAALLRGRFAGI
jgi:2-haloacid dehalogenase